MEKLNKRQYFSFTLSWQFYTSDTTGATDKYQVWQGHYFSHSSKSLITPSLISPHLATFYTFHSFSFYSSPVLELQCKLNCKSHLEWSEQKSERKSVHSEAIFFIGGNFEPFLAIFKPFLAISQTTLLSSPKCVLWYDDFTIDYVVIESLSTIGIFYMRKNI